MSKPTTAKRVRIAHARVMGTCAHVVKGTCCEDCVMDALNLLVAPLERELAEARARCERFRRIIDDACAVTRLPNTDNDGGPADLAEEISLLKNNWNAAEQDRDEWQARAEAAEKECHEIARRLMFFHECHAAAPQPTTEGVAGTFCSVCYHHVKFCTCTPTPEPHAVRIGHRSDCPHFPHLSLLGKTCTCDYADVVRVVETARAYLALNDRMDRFSLGYEEDALRAALAALREGGE